MKWENEIVKSRMQGIAKMVEKELPSKWGFVVLAFKFGEEPGNEMLYASNANRHDVIKAMEEFSEKTKETWGNDTGKYTKK